MCSFRVEGPEISRRHEWPAASVWLGFFRPTTARLADRPGSLTATGGLKHVRAEESRGNRRRGRGTGANLYVLQLPGSTQAGSRRRLTAGSLQTLTWPYWAQYQKNSTSTSLESVRNTAGCRSTNSRPREARSFRRSCLATGSSTRTTSSRSVRPRPGPISHVRYRGSGLPSH